MKEIVACAFILEEKTTLAVVQSQQQASCYADITATQLDPAWMTASLYVSSCADTTVSSHEVQKMVFFV